MNHVIRLSFIIVLVLMQIIAQAEYKFIYGAANVKPFTINDLLKVRRVADPQLSPDGRTIAYVIADTDIEANKRISHIYLISIDGGQTRQLTSGNASAHSPRWSPDGKRIAYISAQDGIPQIWIIDITSNESKKITTISTGASGPIWSPDGNWMAFTSDVYPECTTDECNKKREEQVANSKVKAKVIDRLLYRHWDTWKDGKRTHVWITSSDGRELRDLTPGDFDAPPFSLGGPIDYAFSPDSKELAFARNTDKDEALSTNADIFVVPVVGGEAQRITSKNPAGDLSPQYSPDGRYIVFRSQAKPGFESDQWQLTIYDRTSKQTKSLTENLDSWVESFTFTRDSKTIYLTAAERGRHLIYSIPTAGGTVQKLVTDGFNDDISITPDNKTLVFTRQSAQKPIEVFRSNVDGTNITQVTKTNDDMLAIFNLKPAEDVTWDGAEDTKIHGFIYKPANFTPEKKWPLLVLIHGGPQSAWTQAWSYRWNPQVFASAGYVVFTPNPRGSTGYGQKFINEISEDWAGKVFIDIMKGVEHMVSLDYIDRDRIGGAGASYGGYMVNWIEGHNDNPKAQFKVLVSHAGLFNLVSMYGATEELWFPEWEFKGTPWDNPELYQRWSPHNFVKNFKTPMLVIHGELDYRVPVGEGFQMFTALQRRGVPSRLLYFPDEGHWIMKPANSQLWYNTVLDWLNRYLKQ
jgi:dipeptidyl aminopeptidase/acylaminoacyl peptidase